MIYMHALTSRTSYLHPRMIDDGKYHKVNILLTCQLAYTEALGILFESKTFNISLPPMRWSELPFDHSQSLLRASNNYQGFHLIRHLSLSYDISLGYYLHITTTNEVMTEHLRCIYNACISLQTLTLYLLHLRDSHSRWPQGQIPTKTFNDSYNQFEEVLKT